MRKLRLGQMRQFVSDHSRSFSLPCLDCFHDTPGKAGGPDNEVTWVPWGSLPPNKPRQAAGCCNLEEGGPWDSRLGDVSLCFFLSPASPISAGPKPSLGFTSLSVPGGPWLVSVHRATAGILDGTVCILQEVQCPCLSPTKWQERSCSCDSQTTAIHFQTLPGAHGTTVG